MVQRDKIDYCFWGKTLAGTILELSQSVREGILINNLSLEKLLHKLKAISEKIQDRVKSLWDWDCDLLREFINGSYPYSVRERGYQELRAVVGTMGDVNKGVTNPEAIKQTNGFLIRFSRYVS